MNLYSVVTRGLLAAGFLFLALVTYDVAWPAGTGILLALAALFGYLSWRHWRQPKSTATEPQAVPRPPTLRAAYITCGTILALDVLFFGAPALGVYAGLALVLWLAPRILFVWRKPDLRRHRALVALITAGALAADVGAYWVYDSIAAKRVAEVADASARYKARTGAYPQRLQALVPDFLPEVPVAKPGLVTFGNILYLYKKSDPGLMYVSFPPFGRKVLNVETREWTMMD